MTSIEPQKLCYRDLQVMLNALGILANRALTSEQRVRVARCVRAVREAVQDYTDECARIMAEVPAVDIEAARDEQRASAALVEANRAVTKLSLTEVEIVLPPPLTDAMLPKNDKTHPNNEDGLAAILADLGPLYEIDDAV